MHTHDKNMIKWVKTWKKAASALKKVQKSELTEFDYSKNYQLIDEMLQYACEHGEDRTTSGLIEQQRLFMKFARQLGLVQ